MQQDYPLNTRNDAKAEENQGRQEGTAGSLIGSNLLNSCGFGIHPPFGVFSVFSGGVLLNSYG